jgi:hypothetical protein
VVLSCLIEWAEIRALANKTSIAQSGIEQAQSTANILPEPAKLPEGQARAVSERWTPPPSVQPARSQTTPLDQTSGGAATEPLTPCSGVKKPREHIQEDRLRQDSITTPHSFQSATIKKGANTEGPLSPVTPIPVPNEQQDGASNLLEDLPLFVGSPGDESAIRVPDNAPQVKSEPMAPRLRDESMANGENDSLTERKFVKPDDNHMENYISISDDSDVEIISMSKQANSSSSNMDWSFVSDVLDVEIISQSRAGANPGSFQNPSWATFLRLPMTNQISRKRPCKERQSQVNRKTAPWLITQMIQIIQTKT